MAEPAGGYTEELVSAGLGLAAVSDLDDDPEMIHAWAPRSGTTWSAASMWQAAFDNTVPSEAKRTTRRRLVYCGPWRV